MEFITINKILGDIERIGTEKKAVAMEYGIQSNKAAEIEAILWKKANELRRQAGMIDNGAFYIFNRCFNLPEAPAKLRAAMEPETDAFIKGYIEYIRPQVEKRNKFGRYDNRIMTLNKILAERSKSNDTERHALIASLQAQTADFKFQYVENILVFEKARFNAFYQFKDMRCWVGYDRQVVISSEYAGLVPENISVRWVQAFNNMKTYSNGFDQAFFEDRVRRDATADYDANIEVIADRVRGAGMDTGSVKVEFIGNDPKAFEMYLSDGIHRLHCRSVFCAEFSVLVSAHWRFIITNA